MPVLPGWILYHILKSNNFLCTCDILFLVRKMCILNDLYWLQWCESDMKSCKEHQNTLKTVWVGITDRGKIKPKTHIIFIKCALNVTFQKDQTTSGKVLELVCMLKRKDTRTFSRFVEALEANNCHVVAEVLQKTQPGGQLHVVLSFLTNTFSVKRLFRYLSIEPNRGMTFTFFCLQR